MAAVAAIAGATAASAYLNAKFHIEKDLKELYSIRRGRVHLEKLKKQNKVNLYGTFRSNAETFPDADCLWTPTATFTWAQTLANIHRYAAFFISKGVRPGDIVAFYLNNCAEFIFAWLALASIAAAPAMLNFHLRGDALVHCVRVAEAKFILVDSDMEQRERIAEVESSLDGAEPIILDDVLKAEIAALPSQEPPREFQNQVNATTTLALRYTSGTTGLPKAVRTPITRPYQITFGKFADLGVRKLPAKNADRWYACVPLCHATAGSVSMGSLLMGVTLCIGRRFSVSNFWNDIRASKATMFVYVGEICRYLLAAPPSPLDRQHCVRLIYGNGLRPDVWKRFQERFGIETVAEFFGSTEGMVTFFNVCRGDYIRNAIGHDGLLMKWYNDRRFIPVEIDGTTGEIFRDPKTGFARRMPHSIGGEIIVPVPNKSAFIGYYKNPKATDSKFERDVFHKGDLYYRCGDSLRRDEEGRWFFNDRLGDTFRWKSENVSTAEVGACLGTMEGVIDANVYGVEVPGYEGRAGCAAILLEDSARASFDLQNLLRHARKGLPQYAVPTFVRLVENASLNNSHKQDKVTLRKEGVDPTKVSNGDRLYVLRGNEYVPLGVNEWAEIVSGKSRL
ncbi:acetyl-CoA synthetase-like protein [Rhizodiscina lignyota]|uniref:Very long-chain fatty acid transport protein n=1 Tax=Rhizodiscina lignyota TaxID=1504668 RepID=A0A9P4IR98_9PEZI|nr:acetyl-CoA synthetase-like protein [Rhizodiscina lignyota]